MKCSLCSGYRCEIGKNMVAIICLGTHPQDTHTLNHHPKHQSQLRGLGFIHYHTTEDGTGKEVLPTSREMIRFDKQERRGLQWLRTKCKHWRFTFKRHRKYTARGNFSAEEIERLKAIGKLEEAIGVLLKETKK